MTSRLLKGSTVVAVASSIVLLTGTGALAATSATSTANGSKASCSLARSGSGMKASCTLWDTKADGNSVRIEWGGPGKNGKDNLTSGNGTHANHTYTFARRGTFWFKVVTDRGIWPDYVGPTQNLSV